MEPPDENNHAVGNVNEPDRPRVVVSVTASADGRVTLRRSSILLEPETHAIWQSLSPPGAAALLEERRRWIEDHHGLRVVLEGSGSLVTEGTAPPALPASELDTATLLESYLPAVTDGGWFVVVDGRGRIRWTYKGDGRTRLLVLVCRSTPPAYLAYLRREEIPYLVAGADRVDLPLALPLLKAHLGAGCVISEAGGGLNGALLRAGLVDELHLVLLPALLGGRDTPTTFDGPTLGSADQIQPLRLLNVRTSEDGAVWLHYVAEPPRRV